MPKINYHKEVCSKKKISTLRYMSWRETGQSHIFAVIIDKEREEK